MPNNKKNPSNKNRIPSVEKTNARAAKEFAEQDTKTEDAPPNSGDSKVFESSMQINSSVTEKAGAGEIFSGIAAMGSDGRPLQEPKGTYFPSDSHETDENARKLLQKHSRDSNKNKRVSNPPLLLEDLRELLSPMLHWR